MPRPPRFLPLALTLAPVLLGCRPDSGAEPVSLAVPGPRQPTLSGGLASLNGFVENRGQWPDEVLFFARLSGVGATVLRDTLVFRPLFPCEGQPAPPPLVLRLPGDA